MNQIASIAAANEKKVKLQLGFYVAPSLSIYDSMKNLEHLPGFITTAKHGLVVQYDVATRVAQQRPGVMPVLCAVPLSSREGTLFRGADMLPLGVVGSDK